MGFQGSNASGRRIMLLPGAFWAHGAFKMAVLGASFLLCILQYFRVWEGMLPPGACRMSHASARRIVSYRGLCVSSPCSQIPLAPAPTFGAFRFEDRNFVEGGGDRDQRLASRHPSPVSDERNLTSKRKFGWPASHDVMLCPKPDDLI